MDPEVGPRSSDDNLPCKGIVVVVAFRHQVVLVDHHLQGKGSSLGKHIGHRDVHSRSIVRFRDRRKRLLGNHHVIEVKADVDIFGHKQSGVTDVSPESLVGIDLEIPSPDTRVIYVGRGRQIGTQGHFCHVVDLGRLRYHVDMIDRETYAVVTVGRDLGGNLHGIPIACQQGPGKGGRFAPFHS